ncbi:SH3 domain-containing protein [Oryctes borbonicus]|uniref:Peroxisomal membrane protein PEX13 n=1 Tax=Oryctes borbonicus TaxID=1629725 RepID=A0A0T6B0U4_9SCAR|nr:SH3 domain-containing protein [Oryctes borbonicus]
MGYGNYNSLPYRSSLYSTPYSGYSSYGTYGGYNSYGGMGNYPAYGAEDRFIQYAEERSRNTFSNIENVVRAFSSISMMLDNTFFAMTSSFRAVLSVAENFGRLRSVFGQIWYSVNIFRLIKWLFRKIQVMFGLKATENVRSLAWNEALSGATAEVNGNRGGASWSTLAFLGVIISTPYIISKFLPKYEDKYNPNNWLSAGVRAKAAFDFVATSPNELTINTNDEIVLAPKHIQQEMALYNSGWAYATCNGRSGVIPLNYIVVVKNINKSNRQNLSEVPMQKPKRVSFGENQIFELKNPPENSIPSETEKAVEVIIPDSKEEKSLGNMT